MNIPEYNTELANNIVSNLANLVPGNNESSFSHMIIFMIVRE